MKDWSGVTWSVGDIVQLKKTHPCGGNNWRIQRVGMDFRLQCTTCGRQIMLPRQEVIRRIVAIVEKQK